MSLRIADPRFRRFDVLIEHIHSIPVIGIAGRDAERLDRRCNARVELNKLVFAIAFWNE